MLAVWPSGIASVLERTWIRSFGSNTVKILFLSFRFFLIFGKVLGIVCFLLNVLLNNDLMYVVNYIYERSTISINV